MILGRIARAIFEERHPCVRVRGLFLSGLGLVYLCAFASLWAQVHGLIGENGIVPAGDVLDWWEAHGRGPWQFPTLLWIGWGDRALDLFCGGGVVLSVLVVAGFLRLPCLVLLWAFYLSLFTAGEPFLSFQWDTLLLESGFLAIFLAPWNATPWGARGRGTSKLALWAQRYLLFRLMFASGLVKILARDHSWRDLTALTFHYETQPLPTWTSWHVHHFPLWFHKGEVLGMLLVELLAPFLIILGRKPRLAAFVGFAGLQVAIAATGNYGFFNLLTAVLSLTILDDAMLPWKGRPVTPAVPAKWAAVARRCALVPLLVLATLDFWAGLHGRLARRDAPWPPWPRWVEAAREKASPFQLTSSYGLFQEMTKERREIVVEGSRDGEEWLPYAFEWKPGDPLRAPGFVGPHMPRLDWQMWFAALSSYGRPDTWWFQSFLMRLLENEPAVTALLEKNPFEGEPPRYVRATLYRYEFTTAEERRATGAWWKRTEIGAYTPVISLR